MADLPEDPSLWPRDPYRLLGLEPGASALDARKAYTRLIRRYKPEQFPEQFRRIRDAYEAIQAMSAWLAPPPGFSPQPTPAQEAAPVLATRTVDPGDDLDRLWEWACDGREAEAYQALRTLAERPDCLDAVFVRLYWLLRCSPELDPTAAPCDWLARGLRGGGWGGPCHELYHREIDRDPAEALRERFTHVLEAPAPLPVLTEWLSWRWQAAGLRCAWSTIIADIERFRPRFTADLGDDRWPRLLMLALDQLAWGSDDRAVPATAQLTAEVEARMHLRDHFELHRLDVLRETAATWQALRQSGELTPALLDLVPLSWTRPSAELRLRLQAVLLKLLADPIEALEVFDRLRVAAPLVFAELALLLERVSHEPPALEPTTTPPEELAWQAVAFVTEEIASDYVPPREQLLRFCVREMVTPEEALAALRNVPGCPAVCQALASDEPLRLTYQAHRWLHG